MNNVAKLTIGDLIIEVVNLYELFMGTSLHKTPHYHSFYEIHFILNGEISFEIDGETLHAKKNTAIFLHKTSIHSCKWQSDDLQTFSFCFDLHYAKSLPIKNDYEYGYFNRLFSSNKTSLFKITAYDKMLIKNIYKNTNNFSLYGLNKINLETANLFMEISYKLLAVSDIKIEEFSYSPASDSTLLRKYKVTYFFCQTETIIPTIQQLADFLSLSVRQTSRFLNDNFHKTFFELYTESKMNLAQKLIIEKQMSLEQIAYHIGYSSYANFLTAYKNYYGCTPTEYIQNFEKMTNNE